MADPTDQSRIVPSSEEDKTFFPTPRIARPVIDFVCPVSVRGFVPSYRDVSAWISGDMEERLTMAEKIRIEKSLLPVKTTSFDGN